MSVNSKVGALVETKKAIGEMSRRGFLKLGLAGVVGAALLLVAGCVGEEVEDDDDDGRSRRRRRR